MSTGVYTPMHRTAAIQHRHKHNSLIEFTLTVAKTVGVNMLMTLFLYNPKHVC